MARHAGGICSSWQYGARLTGALHRSIFALCGAGQRAQQHAIAITHQHRAIAGIAILLRAARLSAARMLTALALASPRAYGLIAPARAIINASPYRQARLCAWRFGAPVSRSVNQDTGSCLLGAAGISHIWLITPPFSALFSACGIYFLFEIMVYRLLFLFSARLHLTPPYNASATSHISHICCSGCSCAHATLRGPRFSYPLSHLFLSCLFTSLLPPFLCGLLLYNVLTLFLFPLWRTCLYLLSSHICSLLSLRASIALNVRGV